MKISFKRKTLGSEIEVDRIVNALSEALPDVAEAYRGEMETMAYLAVHTRVDSLELDDQEKEVAEYKQFHRFLKKYQSVQEADLVPMWTAYCDLDQAEILHLWITGYRNAHKPLVPRVQMDGRLLTVEEQEAVANPENPLSVPT